jgi:threonine dehydratase
VGAVGSTDSSGKSSLRDGVTEQNSNHGDHADTTEREDTGRDRQLENRNRARETGIWRANPFFGSNRPRFVIHRVQSVVTSSQIACCHENFRMTYPLISLADVFKARLAIAPYVQRTPILEPPELAEALGCSRAVLKCENLAPTGAFKVRGGINLVANLSPQERARGVLAVSTGNHAQSIAYAARLFGVRALIYMPEGANPLKVAATKRLGADVVQVGHDFDSCRAAVETVAQNDGMRYVHSANEPLLIAGVATATLELLETAPDLEILFVPIGAGSGVLGAAIVARAVNPAIRVIGVQAEGASAVYQSWKQGRRVVTETISTFAEGLATRQPFELPMQWIPQLVHDIRLVSDDDLLAAMKLLFQTSRQVVEGAGAAAAAAAMNAGAELSGKRVGLVVSGGNIPAERWRELLADRI